MADFEIIEADFQQFYHLDLAEVKFRRFARLLVNLPPESRMVQKYSAFKDWNWDKEVQAQILHGIDVLTTMFANSHRKKGTAPLKAPKLAQPKYVEDAKKELADKPKVTEEEKEDIIAFFKERNNQVNDIEEKIKNGSKN